MKVSNARSKTSLTYRKLGVLQVLASGVGFGFLGLFGRWAYAKGFRPLELLSLRFAFSALFLAASVFVGGRMKWLKAPGFRISRALLGKCFILGCFGYAVFAALYFYTLTLLSASMTVLLFFSYPVFVVIGARLFWKERLSLPVLISLILVLFGVCMLLNGELGVLKPQGVALGLGSAVFYASYILVSSRYLKNEDAVVATIGIQFFAAVALGCLGLRGVLHVVNLVQVGWATLLLISTVSTIVPMILFLEGLKKVSSSEVSILSTAEPLTAVFLAQIFLGESLATMQLFGGLLVLAGVALVSLKQGAHS